MRERRATWRSNQETNESQPHEHTRKDSRRQLTAIRPPERRNGIPLGHGRSGSEANERGECRLDSRMAVTGLGLSFQTSKPELAILTTGPRMPCR